MRDVFLRRGIDKSRIIAKIVLIVKIYFNDKKELYDERK
jgi:hypothetical protein